MIDEAEDYHADIRKIIMRKKRLDEILIAEGKARDKKEAFVIVTEGRVTINGRRAISPAELLGEDEAVELASDDVYVGRGAVKLAAALDAFRIDPAGKICLDIGAATGGFTDVLLRRGADRVYAVDTARGKMDLKIRQDPRVVVMEQTDIRDVKNLPDQTDIAVMDVSLISLRDILPSARRLLRPQGIVVALFKPQYETRDPALLRHGVIRDGAAREALADAFARWAADAGWSVAGRMLSPIRGDKGNAEYLFYLKQKGEF